MPPTSRGKPEKAYRVVKPKKNKKHTTASSRNHRFQTFNERITNLKIDPVRRKRHVESKETVTEDSHTFFGDALETWKDTCLAATFTAFAKEVSPLCDNLAVVLYNENQIMDLLVSYIEKEDALAMEPLLALLAHFAHDLDARFEKHFERAVATVTAVAAKHPDSAVIEWSFTCLAWLFKYLSRLLVPDLRSLYDLMAPYLGKQLQKPYIVRFTAEALSFLVRKAAVIFPRDETPLNLIIGHMLQDCYSGSAPVVDLQQQGIMTLLTEAVKGVQNGINSNAAPVLQSLFRHARSSAKDNLDSMEHITTGILTSLIHHCTSESFKPILDVVLSEIDTAVDSATSIRLCSSMLFTIMSVRKGTRITEWKTVMEKTHALVGFCQDLPQLDQDIATSVLGCVVVAMQTATVDAVLRSRQLVETCRSDRWQPFFPMFCHMFIRMGTERFRQFILPHFQTYILHQPEAVDDTLFAHIAAVGGTIHDYSLRVPPAVIDLILIDIEATTVTKVVPSDALERVNMKLSILPYVVLDERQSESMREILFKLVKLALDDDCRSMTESQAFAVGPGLEALLQYADSECLHALWQKLCTISPNCIRQPKFWSNLLRFVKICKPKDVSGAHMELLEDALIACLSMPSHSLRQDALDILCTLYQLRGSETPAVLSIAATIESIPLSLDTERSLSMNIRRLGSEYLKVTDNNLMLQAIPTYCFGLLHLKLTSAWDDAIHVLASMSQSKVAEDVMMTILQRWIDTRPPSEDDRKAPPTLICVDSDGFQALSDFECPNLMKHQAIRAQTFESLTSGLPSPQQMLAQDIKVLAVPTPTARGQALRVLNKMPQLAEKRSRLLVPVLLSWTEQLVEDDSDDTSPRERWTRKDQKAMLAVFAQFTNPKVLYKSDDVYQALLSLCAKGDVEIQRYALKALLAWKDPAITRYEEHLNNLLDEARFREELSVFLRNETEDDDDAIRIDDQDQLMPVLLRLLYGRSIAGGKDGQGWRRKAIFVAISGFGQEVLQQFLNIALLSVQCDHEASPNPLPKPKAPLRQQLGMLNMVSDMLQVLGVELQPFVVKIIEAVLSCCVAASEKLEQSNIETDLSLLRAVRQAGMQCLFKIFSYMTDFDPQQHGTIIVHKLIQPRLEAFAGENAQSISGTLRLFASWTQRSATAELFGLADDTILERLADLLQGYHTKTEVQLFILQEILDKLLLAPIDPKIVQSHVSSFVKAVGAIIDGQPTKELLDACVMSFSQLAGRLTSSKEAADVMKICTELLKKPNKIVSPKTKTGLLRTMLSLIERFDSAPSEGLYAALAILFARLRDVESRTLLSQLLMTLVRDDHALLEAAKICADINAIGDRLDEPDHDRRERAFATIYDLAKTLTLQQWLPIIHNCLYYVNDADDRVNRSSASHALQLFVEIAAEKSIPNAWKSTIADAVLPSIERGMQETSELVRAEYLHLLGRTVELFPQWAKVSGMQPLIAGGDEEASFFSNVLHIQQHRRLRALRRLLDEADSVGPAHASKIFLPLLEHFVFDQIEGDSGRTLADQAVQTIGALAGVLSDQAFRQTFQRYTGYLKTKVDLEKTVLRLLGAIVDKIRLAPQTQGNSRIIIEEQLPPLLEYLHQKDESTVDRRMPVAVTIVKLMLALPEEEFIARLPAVLTDVSHVLRSRSQEARDQTRKALSAISKLVGTRYFNFILRELRSALKRGYQLHVLSYTVHSLLLETDFGPGDVDECLPELMMVIMDDVFGVTGQEKDAEEYKSGMKEVKSSKSFDTLELLARVTPVRKLGELLRPIRSLLSEKLDVKIVKKIDDLLTRLRKGLDQNPASHSREMLSFCWEMVRHVHAEESVVPAVAATVDDRTKRYLVQPEAPKKSLDRSSTTSYRFKLVSFSLNLLRKVLRRHEDLQTPQNMAGFLPIAGDALVQGQEEVKISAMRLLSTIMKVHVSKLEADAPLYVKEAVALTKAAVSMDTDVAKASLELITSVLREKRTVVVKEKDIAALLQRVKADIDEPDKQGIVYKFLRALLGRKIVITEVYEVMDEVGKTMVTNPDRSIRESARSAYLQFAMEYPQGKDRWQKQASFLVGNLQYEHAAGRQSVMEFLHQMLGKSGEDVFRETSPKIFVSLLPVLVGDSDASCREMARLLVRKLFEYAADEQVKHFLLMMETWLKKEKKSTIKAGALQCWAILIRAKQLPRKQLEGFRDKLEDILADYVEEETVAEPQLVLDALHACSVLVETIPSVGLSRGSADLWHAIQHIHTSGDDRIQEAVAKLLGTFFTDLASSSSKTSDGLAGLPLRGSGGLELGPENMRHMCAVNLRALRAVSLSTEDSLVAQIVRNLVFLGRCFAANEMPSNEQSDSASDEDADDIEHVSAPTRSALDRLVHRLSSMPMDDRFSIKSRTASLHCLAAVLNQLATVPKLQAVLRPLYALTDPTVPKPPGELHKALGDKARETLDMIQKKLGSEAYVAALAVTRQETKTRRDERRQKRKIEAVAQPERWAKEKKRKHEGKKEKIKAKGAEARGRRRGW